MSAQPKLIDPWIWHLLFSGWQLFIIIYSPGFHIISKWLYLLMQMMAKFDWVKKKKSHSTLLKFGFVSTWISWIKWLWPLPSIHTNGFRSDHFPLNRSTKKGIYLSSPFYTSYEPLGISVHAPDIYTEIMRRDRERQREHQVWLNAEDLLLYISNPSTF